MKPYAKNKLVLEVCPKHAVLVEMKATVYLVLHTEYFYVLNLKNLANNLFNLLMKFLINFL